MTCTPLDNRYYLFNFFEPTNEVELLLEKWKRAADYIKAKDHFVVTYLHTTNDPNAAYPVVNFSLNDSNDMCCFGKPDEEWVKVTRGSMAGKFRGYPSGYREIASYNGNQLTDELKGRSSEHRFFITGIKVADSVAESDIENNWKSYSGCDVIHKELADGKCSVADSHLYKRFQTPQPAMFKYVTRTEVTGLDDEAGHVIAKLANERAKPEGVATFTSFYAVRITEKHA